MTNEASEWLLVETQVIQETVSCILTGSPLLATLPLAVDMGEKNYDSFWWDEKNLTL